MAKDKFQTFMADILSEIRTTNGNINTFQSFGGTWNNAIKLSLSLHLNLDVYPHEERIILQDIKSLSAGHASRCMSWLMDKADEHNIEIMLLPQASKGSSFPTTDLRTWYLRLGFQPNDREDDYMVYRPGTRAPKINQAPSVDWHPQPPETLPWLDTPDL